MIQLQAASRVILASALLTGTIGCDQIGAQDGAADRPVVGTWHVDKSRQFKSMVAAAEYDLGPLPADLREGLSETAQQMFCVYEFRSDATVAVRFHTYPGSLGIELGTWYEEEGRIVAELTKVQGPGSGEKFTRVLLFEDEYLIFEHPVTLVKWYLQRE